MVAAAVDRIMDFLRERVGEALRTVVILQPDDWTGVYLRDDLREAYDEDTYEAVLDRFRAFSTDPTPDPIGEIGERRALVHYHEEAFVVQLPFEDEASILVSVDADVGRELLTFIEQCREQLYADGAEPAGG